MKFNSIFFGPLELLCVYGLTIAIHIFHKIGFGLHLLKFEDQVHLKMLGLESGFLAGKSKFTSSNELLCL